jgi:hypothetical protein
MIFHTVYMEVPLCKSLDSRRRPNPPLFNANSMPKKPEPVTPQCSLKIVWIITFSSI